MELDACIKGRRSIRRYEEKPVPKEIIEKLLNAGISAPSGMNLQPWRFVVIENKDTSDQRRTPSFTALPC